MGKLLIDYAYLGLRYCEDHDFKNVGQITNAK